jgi:hypothetical protein
MIDLSAVRARARLITTEVSPGVAGFLSVSDWSSATDAITYGNAVPPALYVSLSREEADPNRLGAGGRAQRVRSTVSLLFCLGAELASEERSDPLEITRGTLLANMVGFTPPGAVEAFRGEVLVRSSWDLRGP